MLLGSGDSCLSFEDWGAILVETRGFQANAVLFREDFGHLGPRDDRVPDVNRAKKIHLLSDIDRPVPRQMIPQDGGDEATQKHAVGDPRFEEGL